MKPTALRDAPKRLKLKPDGDRIQCSKMLRALRRVLAQETPEEAAERSERVEALRMPSYPTIADMREGWRRLRAFDAYHKRINRPF